MSRVRSLSRMLAVSAVAAAATLTLTQAAYAEPDGPSLPPGSPIAVPDGNKVFLEGHATGVQIYKCNGLTWAFVAPRADLVGDNGKLVVTHFAGPTWQALDGSTVVATRDAGVTPNTNAIPWLRLKTKSTTVGPDGVRMTTTTYIQRVNTSGGLAKPDGCDPTTVNTQYESPYTADYYFSKSTGSA